MELMGKTFSDDLRDWLSFWNRFKKIHTDPELVTKIHYLLQASLLKSRARQLVESYLISGEKYSKVTDILKSRFGRKDLLVEV